MASAAKAFLNTRGETQEEYRKLASLGRRCSSKCLCPTNTMPAPMFGLLRPTILLNLLYDNNDRVSILRRVAPRLGIDPANLIIRYRDHAVDKGESKFGYATVAPVEMTPQSTSSETSSTARHKRWTLQGAYSGRSTHDFAASLLGSEHVLPLIEADLLGPLPNSTKFFWCKGPMKFGKNGYKEVTVDDFFGRFAELALFRGNVQKGKPRVLQGVPFNLLFGDPDTAAIYHSCESEDKPEVLENFTLDEIEHSFLEKRIKVNGLLSHVVDNFSAKPAFVRSLKAFSSAVDVYEGMEGASITMKILTEPLYQARWISGSAGDIKIGNEREVLTTLLKQGMKAVSGFRFDGVFEIFEPFQLNSACTFACIASFESGNHNISGVGLEDVMAMAVDDSLYIASSLLCDPLERPSKMTKRIRGNLGKAGIAMMIPPESPKIRASEVDNWNVINHDDFDGKQQDCFASTSLHLSFTGWTLPIDTGSRGIRGVEACFLETLISVHDRGQWVADLNILPIFDNLCLRLLSGPGHCKHSEGPNWFPKTGLVSLDSWPEFLERPSGASVVRAKGNWLARLAATTLGVTVGHLTIVLGDFICWKCSLEERERFRHKGDVIFIM